MGALDFWWNATQSSQISDLEERIEKLEEQNQILYEWVQYFKHKFEHEQDSGISGES
jgi:hypothetical protein